MRQLLGLDPNKRVVLVVGGGDGVGHIVKISKEIVKSLSLSKEKNTIQMVVICGSNAKAGAKLKKMQHEAWAKHTPIIILDYVSNMQDYMAASDCIVTKVWN